MRRITTELRGLLAAIRAYPLLSALLAGLTLAIVVVGLLVGGPVQFGVFAAIVAIGSLLVIRWRAGRVGPESRARRRVAALVTAGAMGVGVLALAQAVPYGWPQPNPPETGEPQWATPETRQLMVDACFQCHSNLVEYPWYADVAPMSWTLRSHLDDGRSEVNFSEFATDPRNADESIEEIRSGSMPPSYFTRFGRNPQAKLTEAEKAALIRGLEATPGFAEGSGGGD